MKKEFLTLGLFSILALGIYELNANSIESPSANSGDEPKLSDKEFKLLSLSSELFQINSNLPKKIDENTILNSVSIANNVIVRNHTIIKLPKNFSKDLITREITPRLLSQVCSDRLQRELIDSDINLSMDYYDSNKELIFKLLITSNDCQLKN
jgi:hypothetical protein